MRCKTVYKLKNIVFIYFQNHTLIINATVGCRHSSVDSSAPSILPPRVRVPSTPSMLFLIYICHLNWNVKGTKINKKRPGWPIFLIINAKMLSWRKSIYNLARNLFKSSTLIVAHFDQLVRFPKSFGTIIHKLTLEKDRVWVRERRYMK